MSARYAFSQSLKELRFHLCQASEHSSATRAFLLRAYPTMKKHNPYTPIMIREARGVLPKVWARYDGGQEKVVGLEGLDESAIEGKLSELVQGS